MKKFWTVVGILVFCAGLGWGQVNYVWVGSAGGHSGDDITWEDFRNWEDTASLGNPVLNYPGENPADTATVSSASVGFSGVADPLVLDTLNLGSGADVDFWLPNSVSSTITNVNINGSSTLFVHSSTITNLTINGSSVTVTVTAASTATDLSISGGTVTIGGTAPLDVTNLVDASGILNPAGQARMGGGTLSINSTDVNITGITDSSLGSIQAGGKAVTLEKPSGSLSGGAVTASTLTLSGNTAFTLNNTGNNVTTLQTGATHPASVSFTDANGIALGPITANGGLTVNAGGAVTGGLGIITSSGTVDITTAAGGITLDQSNTITGTFTAVAPGQDIKFSNNSPSGYTLGAVDAGGGNVRLRSSGPVNGSGGIVTASTLELIGNAFTLNNAGNDIATLKTGSPAPTAIDFTDSNGFAVGTVETDSGGAIKLTSASGTVSGGTVTTTGTLTLSGGAGFTLTGNVGILTTGTTKPASIDFTDSNGFTVGTVETDSGGAIKLTSASGTVSGGTVTTTGTLTLSGGAGFTLSGNVGTLTTAATHPVSVSFTDADDIALGPVTASTGNVAVTATTGDITGTGLVSGNVVTLNSGGNINRSGGITSATTIGLTAGGSIANGAVSGTALTAEAGTTITLTNGSNAVTSFTTGSSTPAGLVQLTGNTAVTLTIAAGGVKGNGVTIGNTGNITITGPIDGGAGIITLETSNNNSITINNTINGERLNLIAGRATTSSGSVAVNFPINVTNTTPDGEGENVAGIYILADTVTGVGGTTTGAGGNTCINFGTVPDASFLAAMDLTGGRTRHLHVRSDKHVIYGNLGSPASVIGTLITVTDTSLNDLTLNNIDADLTNDFIYYDSTASLGSPLVITGGNNKNIYVRNVGIANRELTLTGPGTGLIEIDGNYTSNLALTLNPGSRGLRFNDPATPATPATTVLLNGASTAFSTSGANVTLAGDTSIDAVGITVGGNITSSGGAHDLTLDSSSTIGITGYVGTTTARLGDIIIGSTTAATFSGAIWANSYTQSAGSADFNAAQDYDGVNTTPSPGPYGFEFNGTALTISGGLTTSATANSGVGGKIAVANNTGVFNIRANISSGGAFTQTGAGAVNIRSNITTTNTSPANALIDFASTVNLDTATTVTLNSSAGNDNIFFRNATTAISGAGTGRNLTLNAGVSAAAGESVITLYGPVNIGGNFTVTANPLTTNASTTPLAITAASFVVNTNTNVNPLGTMTVTGATTNNGVINAGPVFGPADPETTLPGNNDFAIRFIGNYDGPGDIIAANANHYISFETPAAATTVTFGTLSTIPVDGWLVFRGAYNQTFNPNGKILPNVLVYHSTNATGVSLSGSTSQNDGRRLILYQGFLNLGSGTWVMGNSPAPSVSPAPSFSQGYHGINGSLTLYNGAQLRTRDFYTVAANDHDVLHKAPGAPPDPKSSIKATGNVLILRSFNNTPAVDPYRLNSEIILVGNSRIMTTNITTPNSPALAEIGNLTIGDGSTTNARIDTNLIIRGNVRIRNNANLTTVWYLDPSPIPSPPLPPSYPHIKIWPLETGPVTRSWTQDDMTAVFDPQHSTVEFGDNGYAGLDRRTYEINADDTEWYSFICHEPKAVLLFKNSDGDPAHAHTVNYVFGIDPLTYANADVIILAPLNTFGPWDILYPFSYPSLGVYYRPASLLPDPDVPPDHVTNQFWHFNLEGSARLDMNYAALYYSWSKQKIPVPSNPGSNWYVQAWPYLDVDYSTSPYTYVYDLYQPGAVPVPPSTKIPGSGYNINWFVFNDFFYAFTEDSNNNGKIDRLRLQAAFAMNNQTAGAFNDFEVAVSGYAIDRSRGTNGYARADWKEPYNPSLPSSYSGDIDKLDSIYVYLVEKPYTDGGERPSWQIVRNTSLRDLSTGTTTIGDPGNKGGGAGDTYATIDTVPPRINYALTLPGESGDSGHEVYFQFSEPVANDVGSNLIVFSVSGGKTPGPLVPLSTGNTEFTFTLDTAFEIGDLVTGTEVFTLNGTYAPVLPSSSPSPFHAAGIYDKAVWERDLYYDTSLNYHYQYPSPRYPTNWNYSNYVFVRDNDNIPPPLLPTGTVFIPPYSLLSYADINALSLPAGVTAPNVSSPPVLSNVNHRVTDILISRPPVKSDETTYFAWPLWARTDAISDPDSISSPDPLPLGSYDDREVIWDFTGKRFLELRNITLQVLVQGTLSSTPKIVYAFSIDDSYRNAGLWLPYRVSAQPFFNLVPSFVPSAGDDPPDSSSSPLHNYKLNLGAIPGFKSDSTLDFFLHLDQSGPNDDDLFVARLDAPPGVIPGDWYRRVRPFSFGVHNITRQRGNVTILNNVINSTNRERVFLDYKLTSSGRVTIQVFTLDGNLVKVLVRESQPAQDYYYRVSWDGTNNGGRPVARGMYFIRIVAPDIDEIRKVMVVK